MLLNEFLKEHRNVAEQQSTIAEPQDDGCAAAEADCGSASGRCTTAKTDRSPYCDCPEVSDQVALSKPAPQLVANP